MRKPSKRQLKASIAKIQEEISDNILFINNGGCGIFAYYLAIKLEELGIKFEIVAKSYYMSEEDWNASKENFRLEVLNKEIPYLPNTKVISYKKSELNSYEGFTCEHIMVKIDNYYFDGVCTEKDWEEDEGLRYELDELKLAISTPINWNPMFDRKQMPLIHKIINKHL